MRARKPQPKFRGNSRRPKTTPNTRHAKTLAHEAAAANWGAYYKNRPERLLGAKRAAHMARQITLAAKPKSSPGHRTILNDHGHRTAGPIPSRHAPGYAVALDRARQAAPPTVFWFGDTYIAPGRKTPVKEQLATRAERQASARANNTAQRPIPSPGMATP